MVMLLAQADPQVVNRVCGEGEEQNWLCAYALDATGNQLVARIVGSGLTFARIVIVLVVAYVLARLARRAVTRFARRMEGRIQIRLDRAYERGTITDTQRFRTRRLQRLQAVTGVMRGVTGAVVWLTAIFYSIALLGVSLQPILAGAGLFGIILGFGAQQLVRDVLAGIAMLIEDQFGVGDWIEVEGKFGQVERVGLRSTAFRDVDGVVHHVLNGYIQRVGNLSQEWARATFDVPLALDSDIPSAKALIHKVATDLTQDPVWGPDTIGPPEIWGVQEFGPQGIKIRVVIPTKPLRNWDVVRQLRERLKFAFEQANIRMPTQLVDVGGQRDGYPLLNREADDEPRPAPRRRGLVPPDVGPLDRPPVRAARSAPDADATRRIAPEGAEVAEVAELAEDRSPPRDLTAELRLERGPEPRPD
jgi:moderate conductance mechanosensitive channel